MADHLDQILASEECRRGYESVMSDPATVALLERSRQILRESEEMARKNEEILARLHAQAPTPYPPHPAGGLTRAKGGGVAAPTSLPGVSLDGTIPPEVLELIAARPRGVYVTPPENVGPDGAVRWWVVDAAGVVVFAGRSLHHSASRQGLVNALYDMLDRVCPARDEDDQPRSERDRVRALLDVSDGGNNPPRGRPRTKRTPLRVVAGNVQRRTGRRV